MRIASYAMDLQSAYSASQSQTTQTTIELTNVAATPSLPTPPQATADTVSLSQNGKNASNRALASWLSSVTAQAANSVAPAQTNKTGSSQLAGDMDLSPFASLIKGILEKVLGVHFSLVNGKLIADDQENQAGGSSSRTEAPTQNQSQAPGLSGQVQTTTHYQESQNLSFAAKGNVTTAEGKSFQFSLDVQMQYSYQSTSSQTSRFGRQAHDPLMIILGSEAGAFSGASVAFDLQNTGQSIQLPFAKSGGWLALDRNGDGQINNGSELFGPQSGNGFADLTTLDSNHDGVIDSADPVFAQLQIWTGVSGDNKDQLLSLQQVNIGAILLPSVQTPFDYKNGQNQTIATMKSSGVYLSEDGTAGQISQVDVMS